MNKNVLIIIGILVVIGLLFVSGVFASKWEEPLPDTFGMELSYCPTITLTLEDGSTIELEEDSPILNTIWYNGYIIIGCTYNMNVKATVKSGYSITQYTVDKVGLSVKTQIKRADGTIVSGSQTTTALTGTKVMTIQSTPENLASLTINLGTLPGFEGTYVLEMWMTGTGHYTVPEFAGENYDFPAPSSVTSMTFQVVPGSGPLTFAWSNDFSPVGP